jgi:hypothetical protein
MSGAGELSLVGGSARASKDRLQRASAKRVDAVSHAAREDFIERCTSQSLVVWRGTTPFSEPSSANRVHSAVSHEEPHAPVDSLARTAVVAPRHRRS